MLDQRIIILLPPIESFVTEKTGDIIGVSCSWVVEEPGFRKLNACQQACPKATIWGTNLFDGENLMGPLQGFASLCARV